MINNIKKVCCEKACAKLAQQVVDNSSFMESNTCPFNHLKKVCQCLFTSTQVDIDNWHQAFWTLLPVFSSNLSKSKLHYNGYLPDKLLTTVSLLIFQGHFASSYSWVDCQHAMTILNQLFHTWPVMTMTNYSHERKHQSFTGEAQYSYYDPRQCLTAKNK